jgi:hypothetical protein
MGHSIRRKRRLAALFERHYTPKHFSWLNVVEMELNVLAQLCLDRRIPDEQTPKRRRGGKRGAPRW